jgi:hypothetical protein
VTPPLASGSQLGVDIVILLAVIAGPLIAGAIYWFGLRSARRHDAQHPPRGPSL